MFTLLKVVGERARSPTTFVMITNQKCQLYRIMDIVIVHWIPSHTETPSKLRDGPVLRQNDNVFATVRRQILLNPA